ncbi:response regulator [Pantoea tagorei]
MNNAKPLEVVIVEDEPHLADLHREFIEQHFHLRVVGIAATLEQARQLIEQHQPRLVLLDNYLPDGQGVTLIDDPLLKRFDCSVIFITAASDMQTCSHAMRSGALDYLLKPVFFSSPARLAGAVYAAGADDAPDDQCGSARAGQAVQFASQRRAARALDQRHRVTDPDAG